MKKRHVLLFAALLTVPAGISLAQPDAGKDADAGAAKLTIPPRVEEAELPPFDAEPFPTDKSKAPTIAEWTAAPRVRITRMSKGIGCIPKRVREWVKIRCERQTAGLRLIAGSTDGIALWVPEPLPDGEPFATAGRFSEIVFPVRPGDRRVFEVLTLNFGDWGGWGTSSSYLVEEEWPEGGAPQIAMLFR